MRPVLISQPAAEGCARLSCAAGVCAPTSDDSYSAARARGAPLVGADQLLAVGYISAEPFAFLLSFFHHCTHFPKLSDLSTTQNMAKILALVFSKL